MTISRRSQKIGLGLLAPSGPGSGLRLSWLPSFRLVWLRDRRNSRLDGQHWHSLPPQRGRRWLRRVLRHRPPARCRSARGHPDGLQHAAAIATVRSNGLDSRGEVSVPTYLAAARGAALIVLVAHGYPSSWCIGARHVRPCCWAGQPWQIDVAVIGFIADTEGVGDVGSITVAGQPQSGLNPGVSVTRERSGGRAPLRIAPERLRRPRLWLPWSHGVLALGSPWVRTTVR